MKINTNKKRKNRRPSNLKNCWYALSLSIFAVIIFCFIISNISNSQKSSDSGNSDSPEAALPEITDEYLASVSSYNVLVLQQDDSIVEIPLELYVTGVVSGEMPASFNIEALKAQAVAARTYVTAKRDSYDAGTSKHEGAYVCDTTCCQVYSSADKLTELKSDDWMDTYYNKIKNAVADTAGQLLYYNDELVSQPLFFSASGGRTENSEDVFANAIPYLRSVSSDYEDNNTYDNVETSFSLPDLEQKIETYLKSSGSDTTDIALSSTEDIEILARTDGDGVAMIRFGTVKLTGRQIRQILSLNSASFTVETKNDSVTFTTRGNGHRVGLSQYGADGMAENGFTYKEILSHYYSGTEVR